MSHQDWIDSAGPRLLEKAAEKVINGDLIEFDADDILGTYEYALQKIQKLEEENKELKAKLSAYTKRHSDFMGQTSVNNPVAETQGEK